MSAERVFIDRWNVDELDLVPTRAHHGVGEVHFRRIAERGGLSGACNFIDFVALPPGASIGRHRHADTEEEFYLVLSGEGQMWRDGETFGVRSGDLIRNRPGGEHGLANTGSDDLRVFVFEVVVP